jgi:hypothetical protein
MTGARRWRAAASLLVLFLLPACVSTYEDVATLSSQPPLDLAVFVSGGAFLKPIARSVGVAADPATFAGEAGAEVLPFASVIEMLERATVFQRVVGDTDEQRRRALGSVGAPNQSAPWPGEHLRGLGYDLVLVVEGVVDGPIERHGTNGRWPVTFVTWILLGIGALIPDRTFESRATLRVSMRDVESGRVVQDVVLSSGPVDLALTERTDLWGLVQSILVPPFWVGDDPAGVVAVVRRTTERRLLSSLARELKSSGFRQRLRDAMPADITLQDDASEGALVVVDAVEALSLASLVGEAVTPADAERFATALLRSLQRVGDRYRYEARLPRGVGRVQVRVATLRGGVASVTFGSEGQR